MARSSLLCRSSALLRVGEGLLYHSRGSRPLHLLLLACCACSTVPGKDKLTLPEVTFAVSELQYPSGMRILIEEDHSSPVVVIATVVGVGSSSDPPGKEGLAHFVEHLAFRTRPEPRASVWQLLESVGAGEFNAFTGLDSTIFYEVGSNEALADLLRVEGARLLLPVSNIDAATFNVEREVVRSELRQRGETGYIGQVLGWMQAAVFPPDHPYARPVSGTHETLSAITLADAELFAEKHYQPSNMTMVVVGDVRPQALVTLILDNLPRDLLGGSDHALAQRLPAMAPEPPSGPASGLSRYQAAVPAPEVWLGWSLPRSFDSNSYLQDYAVRSANDQLIDAFWEDGDIVGIRSAVVPGMKASMFLTRVTLREGTHPQRSADHVLNQLHQLWISPESIGGRARKRLQFVQVSRSAQVATLLDSEQIVNRAILRAEYTHFSGNASVYSRADKALATLSSSRVADFSAKYLSRARARMIFVEPLSAAAMPPPTLTGVATEISGAPEVSIADRQRLLAFNKGPGVELYRSTRLQNGLEVIIGSRPGIPTVTVGLAVRGGDGAARKPGVIEIANLVSHPTSKLYGSPSDYGARQRLLHEKDHLLHEYRGAAGNVANLLAIIAQRVQSTKVEQHVFKIILPEVLPYLQKVAEQPEQRAERAFWKALYPNHAYGRLPGASDLQNIKSGDVEDWLEETYSPSNAVLVVVGGIDVDRVEASAREWLEGWRGTSEIRKVSAPPSSNTDRAGEAKPIILVTHRAGASQAQVQLGCTIAGADDNSAARYEVAAEMVRRRMFKVIRNNLGGSYELRGEAQMLRGGAGHLVFSAAVNNAHLARALKIVRATLGALRRGEFDDAEIDRTRWTLARRYAIAFRTSEELVQTISATRSRDWPLRSLDTYPDRLTRVTAKELRDAFESCASGRLVLSLVGDEPVLRTTLKEAWP